MHEAARERAEWADGFTGILPVWYPRNPSRSCATNRNASKASLRGSIERICAGDELGIFDPREILEKAAIIVEERRHYDPGLTSAVLRDRLPAERLLCLDTEALDETTVVCVIGRWLGGSYEAW